MSKLAELKKEINQAVDRSENERILEIVKAVLNQDQEEDYIPDEDELAQIDQSLIDEKKGDLISWEEVKAKLERRDFSDAD